MIGAAMRPVRIVAAHRKAALLTPTPTIRSSSRLSTMHIGVMAEYAEPIGRISNVTANDAYTAQARGSMGGREKTAHQ